MVGFCCRMWVWYKKFYVDSFGGIKFGLCSFWNIRLKMVKIIVFRKNFIMKYCDLDIEFICILGLNDELFKSCEFV